MCLFQSSKKVHCLSCTFVSSSAWSMISFCPFLYWLEDMSPYSAHIFYSNYIFLGLYFLDCESLCIWILFQPFLNSVFFSPLNYPLSFCFILQLLHFFPLNNYPLLGSIPVRLYSLCSLFLPLGCWLPTSYHIFLWTT